ncbi:MAG: LuxR C-terminal-related transcriptional regulator [Desulfurivibrionaceae bacterium]
MTAVQLGSPETPDNKKMSRLHIVGSLQLQNELFSQALADATGLPCTCSSPGNLTYMLEAENGKNCVVLWDCVDEVQETIWSEVNFDLPPDAFKLILFNVSPEQKIETQAIKRGTRGIFYRDDSLTSYRKGIQAVLHGQLWVSRTVLEKCVLETGKFHDQQDEKEQVPLTFREREVLSMIANGFCKDDIADDLGISPHTVKTHTHNIYQKINVKSRIKAALWATQNLKYHKMSYRKSGRADIT